MLNIGTADGYSFTFNARVDLLGQGCDVNTEIVRRTEESYALKMQLQKRHGKARIYMNLSSDHDKRFELNIVTKTPGQPELFGQQTIGSKGLATWQYCCCMHRTEITCDTVWEIWADYHKKPFLLFTISFEECDNNEEQILAEHWIDADGTVDGSNVPSNCDAVHIKLDQVAAVKPLSPKLVRKSIRQKNSMKKECVRK